MTATRGQEGSCFKHPPYVHPNAYPNPSSNTRAAAAPLAVSAALAPILLAGQLTLLGCGQLLSLIMTSTTRVPPRTCTDWDDAPDVGPSEAPGGMPSAAPGPLQQGAGPP